MFRLLSCLTEEHDWRLVLLGGLVCFVTSLVAVTLFHRACDTQGRARALWLATAGAASGCGIWATHFIAMLAYEPGVPIAFDVVLTAVSLLAAIGLVGLGLALAACAPVRGSGLLGGAVVGLAIADMHYTGMLAVQVPGHISWSIAGVAASIGLGAAFAMAALVMAENRGAMHKTLVAALLLTLAIVSHHFTAMGALEIIPDPTMMVAPFSIEPSVLALGIAAATTAVLALGAGGSMVDQRFRNKSEQLDAALNNICQGMAMFDAEDRLVLCNRRYVEMYGLPEHLVRPGTLLRDMLKYRKMAGTLGAEVTPDVAKAEPVATSYPRRLPDGRTISIAKAPLPSGSWVSTHEDITERTNAEEKVRYMARHDVLTGLPNRSALHEEMSKALSRIARGERHAVFCLDLDQFKQVNDTLGHPTGDALLRVVTARLENCVRGQDTVARLGGDEFAVLQSNIKQSGDVEELAQRLIDAISGPYEIDGHQLVIGTSIGIALAPDDGTEPEVLLRSADVALYRAKADGRGTFRFFEPQMDTQLQMRRSLELDLRQALAEGQLEVFYQPILDANTEEVTGCEALLRWHHPQRGMVSPAEFIPLAEEIGLIIPIGAWVLRQATAEAAKWPGNTKIAVNLSPAQFKSPELIQTILNALARSGLAPERLEIEITESVLLQESGSALAVLHSLREVGIHISLDDFGTGYSSLSYLRRFPFDKIKIDRSFIRDLSEKAGSAAIVKAVAGLGRGLGVVTTAEGVETRTQLERVRAEGCIEVQGYLFSPAVPSEEIRRYLDSRLRMRRVA